MRSVPTRNQRVGLQWQIALACIAAFLVSFVIVLNMNRRIATIVSQMNETYSVNRQLTDAQSALDSMEQELAQYLSTRSDISLTAFREQAESWNQVVANMNREPVMEENGILEKNIVYLAAAYQELAEEAIRAKEKRDLDAYQRLFGELEKRYTYLTDTIATLNTHRFEESTINYDNVMASARLSGGASVFMLFLIFVLDTILVVLLVRLAQRDAQIRENVMREHRIAAEGQVKDAQLRYLQAQINPHFLFNTLNAGAQLAMMEDADRTYGYLHKVASFYRYVAGRDAAVVTLDEAVRLIGDYVYIINVRYGGDIHLRCDIDEEVRDFRLPSMILQPIVENAIEHGFRDKEGEKQIQVEGGREDSCVVIRICDNGVGMEEEKIREVMQASSELQDPETPGAREDGKTASIGLPNVIARLRMFYDTEDILRIEPGEDGVGTVFVLQLPEAKPSGEEEDV